MGKGAVRIVKDGKNRPHSFYGNATMLPNFEGVKHSGAKHRSDKAGLSRFLPRDEAGVILGRVDPASCFVDHFDRDRKASLQRTQLLESLALLERRRRQRRKSK